MGAAQLAIYEESHHEELTEYLSADGGYWLDNDCWMITDAALKNWRIPKRSYMTDVFLDFRGFKNERLKLETKYYILFEIRNERISAATVYNVYKKPVERIESLLSIRYQSFSEIRKDEIPAEGIEGNAAQALFTTIVTALTEFFRDFYDDRAELDKDKWNALKIPGVRISAAGKRTHPWLNFKEIPEYYRESVKRFLARMVFRRSWSHCVETLLYLRYYYKTFYMHGYGEGFQENLARSDMEKFLGWVAEDYEGKNATFRSKAVSFIRNYLDFIQLAEYAEAPRKDINRLIFEEDIPRRERAADTLGKVKHIPEPVRNELDAAISEINPPEMQPVYILLRETGWRGTDVLNLRYDSCLDLLWNSKEKEYIPYLCGEITKTGIPMLKIPLRNEVAEMVRTLVKEAEEKSTDENNPDKYLFNIYKGKSKGLPYSRPAFSASVQELIDRKEIKDSDGKIHHFKVHSLRHTRAMEYTEQGMPIGIIQQILGHCSLQMTLHYAKVSEDMLYQKWHETEELGLFKPDAAPPDPKHQNTEGIHYECIRKNLDAVRVPFGVCFKPSKIACKQQTNMCLECASFCTTAENLPEYEAEIRRVEAQIRIGEANERPEWIKKNNKYHENLKRMRDRLIQEGIVHKNGNLREDS